MVGTETYLGVLAVKLLHKQVKCAVQVAESYALVDNKSLYLVEKRRMCSVNCVGTVNTAGRDYSDRRLSLLHGTYLYAGGLSSENHIVVDVESILCISCRVMLRHIERLKAVMVGLDLGAVNNIKAHAKEYFLYFFKHCCEGVKSANFGSLAGESNVDGLRSHFICSCLRFESLCLFCDLSLDLASHLVCKLTDNGSFLCGKSAHLLEYGGKLALFAEKLNSQLFHYLKVAAFGQLFLS